MSDLRRALEQAADAHRRAAEVLTPAATAALARLQAAIDAGHTVLVCGNGGSAAESQHFAAELTGRFVRNRRALPAVALTVDSSALTAIANDFGFEHVFARQVEALGRPGDVLVAISTSGNSPSVVRAAEAARARGMGVVALTGADPGALGTCADEVLAVPDPVVARVQEVHLTLLHAWCEQIELATDGRH